MNRHRTFSEQVWPDTPDMRTQAADWAERSSKQILDWTWRAFELLRIECFHLVDWTQPMEQLERDLTARHFARINLLWARETNGFGTLIPTMELPELESRPGGKGKPSAPDFAFLWTDNERINFPVEAKLVKTPGALAAYQTDIAKFVSGIVAPHVGEGALLGYLLSGSESEMFDELSSRLGQSLTPYQFAQERAHRTTHHDRSNAPRLRLHHLALRCSPGR